MKSTSSLSLAAHGRDLRIDFARGLALWFMLVDHIPPPGFLKPQLAATRASPAVAGTGRGSVACKSRTHQRRSQTRAATMLRPALRENATDPPIAAGGARNLR
jgi:hypothetical protein